MVTCDVRRTSSPTPPASASAGAGSASTAPSRGPARRSLCDACAYGGDHRGRQLSPRPAAPGQHALRFYGKVGYLDYRGAFDTAAKRGSLPGARRGDVLMLRNHGPLVIGESCGNASHACTTWNGPAACRWRCCRPAAILIASSLADRIGLHLHVQGLRERRRRGRPGMDRPARMLDGKSSTIPAGACGLTSWSERTVMSGAAPRCLPRPHGWFAGRDRSARFRPVAGRSQRPPWTPRFREASR